MANQFKIITPYDIQKLTPYIVKAQEQTPVPEQYVSDYDDPYSVNSLADVILATANPNMKRTSLLGIEKIPILNIIPSYLLDVVWDKQIKPIIKEGDWASAGINTLTNLFETLDVAANPVRAAMQGENVLDALGWGTGGRKNFDYNIETGDGGVADFAANFIAEFVSDPINWVTLGVKGLAQAGVKEVTSTLFEEGAQRLVRESMDDIVEGVGEQLTRSMVNDDVAGDIFKQARRTWMEGNKTSKVFGVSFQTTENSDSFSTVLKNTIADYERQAGKSLRKATNIGEINDATRKALDYVIENIDAKISNTILNGVRNVVVATDNVEKGLLASVLRTTPIGLAMVGAKSVITNSGVLERFYRKVLNSVVKNTSAGPVSLVNIKKFVDSTTRLAKANAEALAESGKTVDQFEADLYDSFVQMALSNNKDEFMEAIENFHGYPDELTATLDAMAKERFNASHGIETFDEYAAYLYELDNDSVNEYVDRMLDVYKDFKLKAIDNAVDSLLDLANAVGDPAYDITVPLQKHLHLLASTEGYKDLAKHYDYLLQKPGKKNIEKLAEEIVERVRALAVPTDSPAKIVATSKRTISYPERQAIIDFVGREEKEVFADVGKKAVYDSDVEHVVHTFYNRRLNEIADAFRDTENDWRIPYIEEMIADFSEVGVPMKDKLTATIRSLKGLSDALAEQLELIAPGGTRLSNTLRVDLPADTIWEHDSAMISALAEAHNGAENLPDAAVEYITKTLRDGTKLQAKAQEITFKMVSLQKLIETTIDGMLDAKGKLVSEAEYTHGALLSITDNVHYKLQMRARVITQQVYDSVSELTSNLTGITKFREDIMKIPDDVGVKEDLMYMAHSIEAYNKLNALIQESNLSDELKDTVNDILHSFKNVRISHLKESYQFESFLDKFETKMVDQLLSKHYQVRSSLEDVVRRYKDELELPDNWEDMFHTAGGDVAFMREVVEKHLQPDFKGKLPVYMDFETSSSKVNIAVPNELAFSIGNEKVAVHYMNPDAILEPGALKAQLGKAAEGKTINEMNAMWKKIVESRNMSSFNDAIVDLSRKIIRSGRPIVFVSYNGEVFDMPLLKRYCYLIDPNDSEIVRMAKAHIGSLLRQDERKLFVNHYDPLIDLQKRFGFNRIDDAELETIKDMIGRYVSSRLAVAKQYPSGHDHFIYKIDTSTRSMLKQSRNALLDLTKVKSNLKSVMLADIDETLELINQTLVKMSSTLNYVGIVNRYLRAYGWIPKELFTVPPVANGQNIMDISQLTWAIMPDLNARKVSYIMFIRNYFDVEDQLKAAGLESELANKLFNKAELLDRTVSKITAPELITDAVEQQLDKLIAQWMPYAAGVDGNYKYLRLADRFQKYAVAQQMYYDLKVAGNTKAIQAAGLIGAPEALNLVQNPTMLRGLSGGPVVMRPSDKLMRAKFMEIDLFNFMKNAYDTKHALSQFNDTYTLFKTGDKTAFAMQHEIVDTLYDTIEYFNSISDVADTTIALKNYTDAAHMAMLEDLITMPWEDLANAVWARQGTVVLAYNPKLLTKNMNAKYQEWINNLDEVRKLGISAERVGDRVYLGINPDSLDKFIDRPKIIKYDKDIQIRMGLGKTAHSKMRALNDVLDHVSDGRSRFSTGAIMSKTKAQMIYDSMPESIRKKFVDPEMLSKHGLFDFTAFDRSLLGTSDYRKELFPNSRSHILKEWAGSAEYMMSYADGLLKTRIMFFGNNSPYLVRNMFSGSSDKDILDALKSSNGEYTLAVLTTDAKSKTGFAVRELPATAAMLRQDSVVVLPKVMLHDMQRIWNHMEFSNALVKAFDKLIISPLKAGYLMTFGWVMRNFISSEMANIVSMDGLSEIGDMAKSQLRAAQILRKYTEWFDRAVKYSGPEANGLTNAEGIDKLFKELTAEEQLLYKHADRFVNSAASGGQLDAVIKAIKGSAKDKNEIDALGDKLQELLWEKNPYGLMIKKPNDFLEQMNRFGKYLFELDRGATTDEALSRVIKTHFNYDKATYTRLVMETVLPFSGFMFNNMKFWIEQIARYGWIGKLVGDTIQEIVQPEKYSNYEINENRSLQYNILAGNYIYENGMTLKLSLAVVDAYSILTDPINSIAGKVNAPTRIAYGAITDAINGQPWSPEKITHELSTNAPVVGPLLQRWYPRTVDSMYKNQYGDRESDIVYVGSARQAYDRTSSFWTQVAPSMFGGVQRLYFFTYNNGDVVYSTSNREKYLANLENGAVPVLDAQQIEELRAEAENRKAKSVYRYTKKPKMRKVYVRKTYARKSYIPRQTNPTGVYNKVMKSVSKTKSRPVERPAKIIGPRLYRDIYTAKGQSRFQSRLLPTTAKNLKYKIRQDWSFLR